MSPKMLGYPLNASPMASLLGWISQYGYLALFGLLTFGIVGLPVPDETLLVFSGYLVSTGRLHPLGTALAAFGGSATGISVSYILGRTLGLKFVNRFGKYVHLTNHRVEKVRGWFQKTGSWLLTVGYYIPGIRHFTAFVAGMSCLRYRTFAAFAYLGAAIWVGTFLALGYFVGERWTVWSAAVERYSVILAIAAAILAAAGWVIRKQRRETARALDCDCHGLGRGRAVSRHFDRQQGMDTGPTYGGGRTATSQDIVPKGNRIAAGGCQSPGIWDCNGAGSGRSASSCRNCTGLFVSDAGGVENVSVCAAFDRIACRDR